VRITRINQIGGGPKVFALRIEQFAVLRDAPGVMTAGGITVNVSMPITTGDVYDGNGFDRVLENHRSKLVDVINAELRARDRTAF
jgi:hypothetical protein